MKKKTLHDKTAYERIYDIVRNIPEGKVMTYGQVAIQAGVATPRVVGFAMHSNTTPDSIPCHRVIFSDGSLTPGYAFGGKDEQMKKLYKEGVFFTSQGQVDLEKSLLKI